MCSRDYLFRFGCALSLLVSAGATSTPVPAPAPVLVQPNLTPAGSRPFHLKALITERGDPASKTVVEIYWMAPNKWRRTIQSETEFSQTLIVNGDKVFEHDSDDYFPLWSQTLANSMVDPTPVLEALMPGDRLVTKANGKADRYGRICLGSPQRCFPGRYGLMESVGVAGHSVDFAQYEDFGGKLVARILIYHVDPGDDYTATVTDLEELKNPDESLFEIAPSNTENHPIKSVVLPEAELRSMALTPMEIIWPQVLDGATSGTTRYYLSLDRTGHVAEILPLSLVSERADGSARRQIMNWKFKPAMKDGVPVQAEGILNFEFNTRAYGPPDPLTDAEARKLATTIVEPVFPAGAVAGATFSFSVAVDEAGSVIEIIAGDGAHELADRCFEALGKWRFKPIVEGGKPLPYRAKVTFRVP